MASRLNIADCTDAIARVEKILAHAAAYSVSDIHTEATAEGLRVRFRFDGLLGDVCTIPHPDASAVIARLKVLAGCDVTERRLPQDGKFCCTIADQTFDCRVATFPVVHGEAIVIRLLPRDGAGETLATIGLPADMYAQIMALITRSRGFLLVTGPTGAGKTTTLYAALRAAVAPTKHCVTLEDPVEYSIDGVSQGEIHPEIGFTFDAGLRALIRQDPDVIMVGEIRDHATARVALHAALTGHLMLSSFHTSDAPHALTRIIDMGVEPYLVAAALDGILAQRLVRMICAQCKEDDTRPISNAVPTSWAIPQRRFYGRGCAACRGTGYAGRTGIFEFLQLTPDVRECIVTQPHAHALLEHAIQTGWRPLIADGLAKVAAGITTLDELLRTAV